MGLLAVAINIGPEQMNCRQKQTFSDRTKRKPSPDYCGHHAASHACDLERSSSESLSKSSNSSPDHIIKDVDNKANVQVFNQLLRGSICTMQQYNSQSNNNNNNNMAYDDHSRYSFNGTQESTTTFGRSCGDPEAAGRNMMLNFGGVLDRLDPSASFPGLGELPSNGLEPAVEQNLTGTFTGDLNSTAYELVAEQDHSRLLQEMLQQHPPPQPPPRLPDAQVPAAASHGDWEDSLHVLQEMVHLQQQQQHGHQIFNQPQMEQTTFNGPNWGRPKFPGESDLLNLLQFPGGHAIPSFGFPASRGKSPLYNSSSTPVNTDHYESRSILGYDPGLNLNHHSSQQRFFHNYSRRDAVPEASRGAPILLVDLDQERDDLSTVKTSFGGKREHHHGAKGEPRGVNHFATERQRREFLNEKYHTLRALVPNPTKADRASIVADAIEYVKELKGRVQELQLLVQEKRRTAGDASSVKRRRSMDGATTVTELACVNNNNNNATMTVGSSCTPEHLKGTGTDGFSVDRCSWLQRTSQNGVHVDVRIVHDEVIIKVNQRRSKTCLLFYVMAVLQDLQLDLVHVSGATVGEHDVFLFNTKILEGTSTFAGYIVVKLLDALDRQCLVI